jgi:hypothetical protein
MILALAVLLGLLASLVRHRGRALQRIAAIPLHWAWLALLAMALQIPLLRSAAGPAEDFRLQQALFLASHVLLLAFSWRNRRLVGILIIGAGILCNLLVISGNGGFMPIEPETLVRINPGSTVAQWPEYVHYSYSKDVILARENTRLWALSDTLVLPPPSPWPTAFSAGDLVIAAGIIVLLQGSAARREPAARTNDA